MRIALLIVLTLLAHAVAGKTLLSLSDPAGDDFGDGGLQYPDRGDMRQGDLDLRRLTIRHEEDGYWFDVELGNIIRDPSLIIGDRYKSIAASARRGFYAFNLDVYIDLDRKLGSGNQFTLPGRRARIDARYAWERAVILTPDPESARAELLGILLRQFGDRPPDEAVQAIDQSMFFARKVRIYERRVSFFVPASFFTGFADEDLAVTAFITAAKPHDEWSINPARAAATKPEDHEMGVMQLSRVASPDSLRYSGDDAPLPIVDLLAPTADAQIAVLSGEEPLASAATLLQGRVIYPEFPLVTSTRLASRAPTSSDGWFTSALSALLNGEDDAPVRRRPARGGPMSLADMLDPGAPAVPRPGSAAAVLLEPAQIKQRLAALRDEFDAGKLTRAEYDRRRQEILDQL